VSRAEELKRGSWWLLCRDSGKNEEGSGGLLRRRMEEKGGVRHGRRGGDGALAAGSGVPPAKMVRYVGEGG
jgi:hypothetical protein